MSVSNITVADWYGCLSALLWFGRRHECRMTYVIKDIQPYLWEHLGGNRLFHWKCNMQNDKAICKMAMHFCI